MTVTLAPRGDQSVGPHPPSIATGDAEGLAELLKPLIAGARARGVADAFDLLGLAAILIGSGGRVLHAAPEALRLLEPVVDLVDGRLAARDAALNQDLQRVITGADSDRAGPLQDFIVAGAVETCGLRIRPIRYPVGEDGQSQLLRLVLLISAAE